MNKRNRKILTSLLIVFLGIVLVSCKKTENTAPVLSGVANTSTPYGVEFNKLAGVTAFDKEDGDITKNIKVTGDVNHQEPGTYTLNYVVADSKGLEAKAERVVTVLEETTTPLANGWYDYKFATAETRHTFFAAAERWLLENAYAGIPLAAQSGLTMQHERIVLPVEDYIPSFGWGTNYSTLTMDDAQVAAKNNGQLDLLQSPAESGKYTYRTWQSQEPETLNYYTGESSTESDYNSYINGSFYSMALNETANGWEFVPELASGEPVPVSPIVVNGKTTAKKWEIPIRTNLKWAYNTGTNTSGFPEGHDKLTATDFEYTYRLALDNEWFRALQGGGDFISQKIKGAEAYAQAVARKASKTELDVLWQEFGIHATPDGTKLIVEFTEPKSTFDIKYGFGAPAVNKALYESNPTLYGTSPQYVASSGLYKITYWEDKVGSRYEKVNTHPLASKVSWTGESIKITTGASAQDQMFTAFENGLLDSVGVPNSRVAEFKDDPRVLRTPGASVWSLNMNMTGSVQAQQAQWPGSSYVPKPILGNADFRLALYFSLNRNQLTQYDAKTYPTGMKISQAYFVDPEGGVPYRSTPQGMAVGENLAYSTNGYDPEAAQLLFKRAVATEIAAGNYKKGTADNYTEIKLEVLTFDADSGAAVADNWISFAKDGFETLVDDENFVKVIIVPKKVPGSQIYDLVKEGNYDLALSSIKGNTLDAASFLDTFITDNRSGFLLNYGYDSSVPEIEVEWTENGVHHKEIFSFNAIYELLNGKVFLKDGDKISEFSSVDSIIDIHLQTEGLELVSKDAAAGQSLLAVFAPNKPEGVDQLVGVLVKAKDESGKVQDYLFVITKTGNIYELLKVEKVSYESSEQKIIDNALTGITGAVKTTVPEAELAEFVKWYELDVENYDEVTTYYFTHEGGVKLLVIGKSGSLYLLIADEDINLATPENFEKVAKLAVESDSITNIVEVTTVEALLRSGYFAKYGVETFGDLSDLYEVEIDLIVYEFKDASGNYSADGKDYVVFFVIAGHIVDFDHS